MNGIKKESVVATTMWTIWISRNQAFFEGKNHTLQEALLMSTNLVDRYYKAFNNEELNYLT